MTDSSSRSVRPVGRSTARSGSSGRSPSRAGRATSPTVRIGLHSADASQRGGDYSGIGVHLAARVAALADGGEIVATADTLAEAGDVASANPRAASLRGVTTPVSVASISWS